MSVKNNNKSKIHTRAPYQNAKIDMMSEKNDLGKKCLHTKKKKRVRVNVNLVCYFIPRDDCARVQ